MGVLVSAAWLMTACNSLPQQPGNESYRPGFVRDPAQSGYNGTIKDLRSSIDPRTPDKEGTPGRSLPMDVGEQALMEQQQGLGGSGAGAGPKYGETTGAGDLDTAPSGPEQQDTTGGPPAKRGSRSR
jgi:hypothetical protein